MLVRTLYFVFVFFPLVVGAQLNTNHIPYEKGCKYGIMTIKGEITLDSKYEGMCHLINDLFTVTDSTGLSGVIDYRGKRIVDLEYDRIRWHYISDSYKFPDNKIIVAESKGGIDSFTLKGKRLKNLFKYSEPRKFANCPNSIRVEQLELFEKGGKYGLYNKNDIVLYALYDSLSIVLHNKNQYIVGLKDDNYILYSKKGEPLHETSCFKIEFSPTLDLFIIVDTNTKKLGVLYFKGNDKFYIEPEFERVEFNYLDRYLLVKEFGRCYYYLNLETLYRYKR